MVLCVVALLWLLAIAALALFGKPGQARAMSRFLPDLVVLFKGLLTDTRVPRGSKWLLAACLAWVASPIDLIPEFIPVLGPLDDVIVTALVLRHLIKRAGPAVVHDHWKGPDSSLALILRISGGGQK